MQQDSSVILINKEIGLSSAKVVAKVKRKFNLKKVGHAGTLDQEASGLLICLSNKATKLNPYLLNGEKTYSGIMNLGIRTTTDDIYGEVIERSEKIPSFLEILEKSKLFIGEIEQTPPNYSAVKINGKRAYKIALEGEKPKIKSKKVTLSKFEITKVNDTQISYLISCTSGTYIRSIARDLGESLGCGGCTETIHREFSTPFSIKNAKKIEDIEESDFICWTQAIPAFKKIFFEKEIINLLQIGNQKVFSQSGFPNPDNYKLENVIYYSKVDNKPLGILYSDGSNWKISQNF